jgi:hypothetical protein
MEGQGSEMTDDRDIVAAQVVAPVPGPGWRPPWAYVPGRTARHADDLFDPIRATVMPGMAPDDLARTPAWAFAQAFLRDRYFWEAHELLEPVWMTCPKGSPDGLMVQGLIQLANAGLKRRMQRPRAVARLLAMASECAADARRLAGGAPILGSSVYAEIRSMVQDEDDSPG